MRLPNPQTRTIILISLVIGGSVLSLFSRALWSDHAFAYRDMASFYDPLFQWSKAEWREGRFPLWNTRENTGIPVLADASSSLFYPGKVFYFLPLSAAQCNVLYVIAHLLLAAVSVYHLARKWRASIPASGIASLSYALSGPILFQYCNVVYLVSAAWMPLAWLALSAQYKRLQTQWTALLAITLAMMVLGGDPQAAYHTILAALLLFVLQWRQQACRTRTMDAKRHQWIARYAGHLVTAVLGAGLLAAVQVLPSVSWTQKSDRAHIQSPQNLYQMIKTIRQQDVSDRANTSNTDLRRQIGRPLLETPQAGTHGRNIYYFSIGPWRLLEWFWPNFSGQRFPQHQRWIEVLPAESPPWTPTLYMGLLPLLIAWSSLTWSSGRVHWRWISWTVILSVLASFGWFGLGWILYELQQFTLQTEHKTPPISPPAGGLYWWMVLLLPGYAQFRFPAKVFTLTTLALSLLAARGWDRVFSTSGCTNAQHRLKNRLLLLSVFSLLAAVFIRVLSYREVSWFDKIPPDLLFGPLLTIEAIESLSWALLHTCVLASVFWGLLHWHRSSISGPRTYGRWKTSFSPALAFLLTALELVFVHRQLVSFIPVKEPQRLPAVASQIHNLENAQTQTRQEAVRLFRGRRTRWAPQRWKTNSAKNRLQEIASWDRDTLRPRYHLQTSLTLVESETSMRPFDYISVLRLGRRLGWMRADGVREPHPHILSALGAEYWLLPTGTRPPGAAPQSADAQPSANPLRHVYSNHDENWALWKNHNSLPRIWVVRRWHRLKPLKNPTWKAVQQRTESVFFPGGKPRNLRQAAVIESTCSPTFQHLTGNTTLPTEDRHVILRDEPQWLEIEVSLKTPALVVIRDYFDTDWKATIETSGVKQQSAPPIMRTNRIMRGIWLSAGKHHVTLRYQPLSFYVGSIISLIAWSIIGAFVVYRLARLTN